MRGSSLPGSLVSWAELRARLRRSGGTGAWAVAVVLIVTGCAVAPRPQPPDRPPAIPSQTFVVRGEIVGGIVEFQVPPARGEGQPVVFPVTVRATGSVTLEGPVRAEVRFTASKQDILIRLIPVSVAPPVTVVPGASRSTVITWDGRNDDGAVAQPDEYVLVLRFRVVDGRVGETATGLAFSVLR